MIAALAADALLFIAVFFETLAGVSILRSLNLIRLSKGFDPLLAFYQAKALPVLGLGARLYPATPAFWYADACVLSAFLFYLFFFNQARRASDPLPTINDTPIARRTVREMILDVTLPSAFCIGGAVVASATLLPLLTIPIALTLLVRRLSGNPSWFQVSSRYYANLVILAAAIAVIYAFGTEQGNAP